MRLVSPEPCSPDGDRDPRANGRELACRYRADEAILKLKQLEAAKLVEVQGVSVIRWPQYAAKPTVREHVTEEGSKVSSLMHRFTHGGIDSSMVQAAKGDMTAGTSVLVLLTSEAAVDAFAKAFERRGVEMIRSDLSVQEQARCGPPWPIRPRRTSLSRQATPQRASPGVHEIEPLRPQPPLVRGDARSPVELDAGPL
jgi:Protein of unknown function (DUF1269)